MDPGGLRAVTPQVPSARNGFPGEPARRGEARGTALEKERIVKYRPFGRSGWKVSALGFGCMRLPIAGQPPVIDEPLATRMLRHAIDQGVNYVDTAYGYHGGESERFVGRVLRDGYRQKVRLATKMPTWLVKASTDFDRYLDEQLEKLQVDRIDFYLLHALNRDRWANVHGLGVLDWAERAVRDGRIGGLGFSFHDAYPVFQEIVDAYERWILCQIQYNYMDVANQAGTRGLQYAASKGLPVVIMEPLLGGKLVTPPPSVVECWDTAPARRSPADWALQWLWNQPEVSVVLSGMSAMEQVEENLASAGASEVGSLTAAELAVVDAVRELYRGLSPIPCTRCGYCMPCPSGVDIPGNLAMYCAGVMFGTPQTARRDYAILLRLYEAGMVPADTRAVRCVQCGACEEKCPQGIPIRQWMPVVHSVLGEGKPYPERGPSQAC